MNIERDIRFELLARLCPNSTGSISFFQILCCSLIFLYYLIWRKWCTEVFVTDTNCGVQGPIFGVFAQRQACTPFELAGRRWLRKTSWRPLIRSSKDTRSLVRHLNTWCTTRLCCYLKVFIYFWDILVRWWSGLVIWLCKDAEEMSSGQGYNGIVILICHFRSKRVQLSRHTCSKMCMWMEEIQPIAVPSNQFASFFQWPEMYPWFF